MRKMRKMRERRERREMRESRERRGGKGERKNERKGEWREVRKSSRTNIMAPKHSGKGECSYPKGFQRDENKK